MKNFQLKLIGYCFLLVVPSLGVFGQQTIIQDSTQLIARPIQSLVLDGAYEPEGNELKKLIPFAPLREADVMYQKRIWQEIDLRQKFNHPFYYPVKRMADRASLFDVIMDGVYPEVSGSPYQLTTYKDDEFSEYLTKEELNIKLRGTEEVQKEDENFNATGEVETVYKRVGSQEITRYRIKEDWIWDKQRSERYIRIIAIAPCIERVSEMTGRIEYSPLFWLDYRECRWVFMNAEAYNPFNDAQRRTFEDLFRKRYFSSYIVKEGNTFNREIGDYLYGVSALSKSEQIQAELFNLEHDMWNY